MIACGGEDLIQFIISETPRSAKGFRGDEVKKWIFNWGDLTNNAPLAKWVILDDSKDFHDDQPLVLVNRKEGLLLQHIEECERILGIY